jgi:hypothetical protein
MPIDLTDPEKVALIELLRGAIDRDRFPLSPRIRLLRCVLEKLSIRSTLAMPSPMPEAEITARRGTGEEPAAVRAMAPTCHPTDGPQYTFLIRLGRRRYFHERWVPPKPVG